MTSSHMTIAMFQVSSLVINPFNSMLINYNEFYKYIEDAMLCVAIFSFVIVMRSIAIMKEGGGLSLYTLL